MFSRYLSEHPTDPEVVAYLFSKIRKPRGQFRKTIRPLIPLIRARRSYDTLGLLLGSGHDALVVGQNPILGYTGFCWRPGECHVYSIHMEECCRGNGGGQAMVEQVMARAWDQGIDRVRLGAGNNDYTNLLWPRIGQMPGFEQLPDNWIRMRQRPTFVYEGTASAAAYR